MTAPRDWKSERVLKVRGSILKEGVFQGHPDEDTTNPNAYKPSKLTPEVIEKAFNNIKGSIPIYQTHDKKGQPRILIGGTFHAGITPSKDDIEVRGMIWNDPAINRIHNERLDRFSPEIDFDWDGQGNIINARIVGLIPTNVPAITNPPIEAVSTVFDSIGGNMPDEITAPPIVQTTLQPGQTGNVIVQPAAPPVPPATVNNVTNNDNSEILKQVNALAAQMTANQEQIKSLLFQNEQLRQKEVNKLLADVKKLGIETPENLITGLPTENQVAVLTTIKSTLNLRAPTVQPGSSGTSGTPSTDDMMNSILKEIGISRKEYDKTMLLPCPSLDREV